MKNILFVTLLLGSTLSSVSNYNSSTYVLNINKKNIECRFGQGQATAKSTGKQCKHYVSNTGDRFCYQHK